MRTWSGLVAGSILLIHSPSYAYNLADHSQLTRTAAAAVENCFPSTLSSVQVETMVEANQWEDLNLLRKWTAYSHFYHPEHDFGSLRATSRDRALDLEAQLRAPQFDSARDTLIGKALHHLQDMAAPPHVVPVNHFWTDGFEKLEVRVEPSFEFSSCQDLLDQASKVSLSELHQKVAEETWKSVRTGAIRGVRVSGSTRKPLPLPLILFWSPNGPSEWGEYGIVGNTFGSEQLHSTMGTFEVPASEYRRLKQERLRSALRASQLLIARSAVLEI
jgi:hypothetical protein